MKIFGFSALGIAIVAVGIGMFFIVIKPAQQEKEIPQREDVVLGTQSRLDFPETSIQ